MSNTIALLITLGSILAYFTIGTVWAGIVTRKLDGDSTLLPACVIVWPLTLPAGLLIALYAKITGRTVDQTLR